MNQHYKFNLLPRSALKFNAAVRIPGKLEEGFAINITGTSTKTISVDLDELAGSMGPGGVPLDPDLVAIAALEGTGFAVRTAPNTWELQPGGGGGGSSVTTSDTPPVGAVDGDLWWESDTGNLYIYYDDETSAQWVRADAGDGGGSGGGSSVTTSDTPPVGAADGDLWWDSSDGAGNLYIYYDDETSSQWVPAVAAGAGGGEETVSVRDYGARCDEQAFSGTTSIGVGSTALTVSTGATFQASDVGKTLSMSWDESGGLTVAWHTTTIAAVVSPTQVTLATPFPGASPLSGATVRYSMGTDDTAAVQAALNGAAGKCITLPDATTTLISGALYLSTGTHLTANSYARLKTVSATADFLIINIPAGSNAGNITVSNLIFCTTVIKTAGWCISCPTAGGALYYGRFYNLQSESSSHFVGATSVMETCTHSGIIIYSCLYITIWNCHFGGIGVNGVGLLLGNNGNLVCGNIWIDTLSINSAITHLDGSTAKIGMLITDEAEGIYASRISIEGGGFNYSLYMNQTVPGVDHTPQHIFFHQLCCDTPRKEGIHLEAGRTIGFTDCWTSSQGVGQPVPDTSGGGVFVNNCTDVRFVNHLAIANTGYGFRIGAGAVHTNILGGVIDGNGGVGVGVESATDFIISGVNFSRGGALTHPYDIYINAAPSDRYVIANNLLTGGVTGDIFDAGTGVNKVIGPNVSRFSTYRSYGSLAGRNLIINGNFRINQRGYVSGTALGASVYCFDRWKFGAAGGNITFAAGASGTTVTIVGSSTIGQEVEGINISGGNYIVSWAGTAQCRLGAGSYTTSPKTVSLTANTNATLEFNAGTLTNVQLEQGSTVTQFEQTDYSAELTKCQRYLEVWSNAGGGNWNITALGSASSTSQGTFGYPFRVRKRIAPALGVSSVSDFALQYNGFTAGVTVTSMNAIYAGLDSYSFQANVAGTPLPANAFVAFGSNGAGSPTSARLYFDAEF